MIDYAGGSLLLTAIYTALIVWIVGLAVPVTASYIICAVIAAPAMIKLGVPDVAAHMFIFYYSVLSEVSPPTALSPFAAAAITGGDPYKTTLQAWKYTLPAFLVPFVFVLDPQGIGLLLKIPKDGSWVDIVLITGKTALGLAALAAAAQGWALRKTTLVERLLLVLAGLLLVFPSLLEALHGGHHRPRHRLHRDIWLGDRRRGPAKTAHATGPARSARASRRTIGRIDDHETQRTGDLRAWRWARRCSPARRSAQQNRPSPSPPAAPAASIIRSAAAWRTCCRNTCPACRRPRASPAARSTISS